MENLSESGSGNFIESLGGTPKQIAWAVDIRETWILRLDKLEQARFPNEITLVHPFFDQAKRNLRKFKKVATFIDNRDRYKLGEEVLFFALTVKQSIEFLKAVVPDFEINLELDVEHFSAEEKRAYRWDMIAALDTRPKAGR